MINHAENYDSFRGSFANYVWGLPENCDIIAIIEPGEAEAELSVFIDEGVECSEEYLLSPVEPVTSSPDDEGDAEVDVEGDLSAAMSLGGMVTESPKE